MGTDSVDCAVAFITMLVNDEIGKATNDISIFIIAVSVWWWISALQFS